MSAMDEPATFRVCRICLFIGEGMYKISEHGLSAMYEQLTGSVNSTEDKLPQALCSKCADGLLSAHGLREMALKTKHILMYKFDLSKHTITLKDIEPVSKQMDEIRSQELKFQKIPKTEFVIEFERENLIENEENQGQTKIKTDLHSLTLTNDEMDTDNDDNENNDETFLEYAEMLDSDTSDDDDDDDDDDDSNDKVAKPDSEIEKDNTENTKDVIKRYKVRNINRKSQNPVEIELDEFTITKISYEEQVDEVEKRKELDSYKTALFKCTSCFKGFNKKEMYENHIDIHDERNGPFECFICKRRYKSNGLLKAHLGRQHRTKYECKLCPFVTKNKNAANNHKKFHSGRTYTCPHCDAEFNQLSTYYNHLRIKHVCEFVCEWCGYTYINQHGLNVHKKSKHRKVDTSELKGPYCEVCDVTFVSDEVYDRHLKLSSKHTDNSDLNRPRNDSTTKTYLKIKPLKKRKTKKVEEDLSEKMVKCEQCGLTIQGVSQYIKHFKQQHFGVERMQHMKTKFMCEQCGRRFYCNAVLKDHLLSHSGKTHFRCEECGKSFATKASYKYHAKSHTAVYECPLCFKQFNRYSSRHKHMLFFHKEQKNVKCDFCDKCFKSTIEKKAHTDHVHEKKPWPKRNRNRSAKPTA